MLTEARTALKRTFGFSSFHPFQEEAIRHVLKGHDVLVTQATGGGKSLCYQIPALLDPPGTVLVISPLIALMEDQVQAMRAHGIAARFINSTLTETKLAERMRNFARGKYQVLLIAPERLRNEKFKIALGAAPVKLIAVDEAHCHPPDTLVTMADGSQRRIDQIDVGHRVLARGSDGVLHGRRVTHHRTIAVGARKLLRISTSHGTLDVTDDHKLYTTDGRQVQAGHLRVGDSVMHLVSEGTTPASNRRGRNLLQFEVLGRRTESGDDRAAGYCMLHMRHRLRSSEQRSTTSEVLFTEVLRDCEDGVCDVRDCQMRRMSNTVQAVQFSDTEASILHFCVSPRVVGASEWGSPPWASSAGSDCAKSRCGAPRRNGTAETTQETFADVRDRVGCSSEWLRKTEGDLETGSRGFGFEDQCRVRRRDAQTANATERPRQATRCEVASARVDRIEILEPRDSERNCAGGFDYRLVHSLTVEIDHNYFAGTARICARNCASQWGHDFRPDYRQIPRIRRDREKLELPDVPMIALTATAPRAIEGDIARGLELKEGYARVIGDPIRANLSYEAQCVTHSAFSSLSSSSVRAALRSPGRHLVYISTRNGTEKVVECLEDLGLNSAAYHAGLDDGRREQVQRAFTSGEMPIVAATSAFGMGIDVPDVRTVLHLGCCGSVEDYVQQMGRAGRDQLPARTILVDEVRDDSFSRRMQRRFVDTANPPIELIESLWDYLCHRAVGTSIAETIETTANAIGEGPNSGAVGTALRLLSRVGAIDRKDGGAGAVIHDVVNRTHLEAMAARTTSVGLSGLIQHVLSKAPPVILSADLGKALGMHTLGRWRAVRDELLEQRGALRVEKTFRGKLTTVNRRWEDRALDSFLDLEAMARKRAYDVGRLEWMFNYSTAADRREYIRTYFDRDVPHFSAIDTKFFGYLREASKEEFDGVAG